MTSVGPRQVHPLHVQGGHRIGVQQQDRQLGERVDAQRIEDEAAELGQGDLVDVDAGLVVDLDAHRTDSGLWRSRERSSRGRRLGDALRGGVASTCRASQRS